MKLTLLKAEVIFQLVVSLIGLLYVIVDYSQKNSGMAFFIALFYVGISNLLGFLLRISLFASKFNQYYFFGVILFFLLLYFISILTVENRIDMVLYFMGVGGVLFNIYYLLYGIYLIKAAQKNRVEE
ncbi:hypothetical protein SAMN05421856_11627 [Chryseobacterium taichungense]|uniref:Uncharacterized protein n=1 Tax=Chryseobacterium taichungense TaxID=295069 RepID=A0A1H8DTM8_9FLAO|nr:hypothetical protein [Chryseobacterium taichungense]SEN10526.1 hypothetical protein SAMN05421856_11627 [Chryseobacterium taichungense]